MNVNRTITLRVNRVQQLTPRVYSYELSDPTGGDLPLVSAGGHIAISIKNGDRSEVRHYALCGNPSQRKNYRIAVLREDKEQSSSHSIIEHFVEGTTFECTIAIHQLQLHADASPSILIAGGIGIAPLIAMTYTLEQRGRRFQLHYAGRSQKEMAFADELTKTFPRQTRLYPTDENCRLDLMNLLADAPSNANFYICCPQKMFAELETSARLLGIPKDRIHYESFIREKKSTTENVILELQSSNRLVLVEGERSLLTALRDAKVNVHFDCCVGDCGTCAVRVIEGEVEHRDHVLTDSQKAQGYMCLCVSRAKSEKLVLDL